MRPLVGISTSELRTPPRAEPLPEGEPPMRELALGLAYPRAVEAAGGTPVVVPPVYDADVEALLDRLDALLLPGGPDIHPSHYGEEPDPALGPTEPDLDAFELRLARRADARRMPILAICRGAQALNVARGGTLIQDLPGHRQTARGHVPAHPVRIDRGSVLGRSMRTTGADVNTFHHQAVRDLGRGLRAVAWAPDGVVEGIEAADRAFAVGVQWHAEGHTGRPEHDALFAAFVDAAAAYAGRIAA